MPAVLEQAVPEEWARWKQRAKNAQARVLENNEHTTTEVWRELKELLARYVFHGLCAYCESWYSPTDTGDAEHYRPKGAVTVLTQDGRRDQVDHPGYYWLAHDWENLLPACSQCNTVGKGTLFPIAEERARARTPGDDRNLEGRLLLHPYLDDPSEHLSFDDDGEVRATTTAGVPSSMGACSIRVYGLQRPELQEARAAAINVARLQLFEVLQALNRDQRPGLLKGRGDYPTAIEQSLRRRELRAHADVDDAVKILRSGLTAPPDRPPFNPPVT